MNDQQQARFYELKSKKGLSSEEQREFEALVSLAKTASEELVSQKAELRKQARIIQILQRVRFNGRVLKDCEANEGLILELPPTMTPEEINSAFAGNPKLAESFLWMDPPASKSDPKVEAKDRDVFAQAARANGNFGTHESNFKLLRDTLGAGFSEDQINQAIRSNAVRLAPPSQEQKDEWAALAEDERKLRLMNATTSELKQEVSAGFEQRRTAFKQAEANRVFAAKQEADKDMGYPPLPEFFKGRRVDQDFFVKMKCTREEWKFLAQKYGQANIEAKISGER